MANALKVPYLLGGFLIFASTFYGQEDCHCHTVVYLLFGGKGKIPCRCDRFALVSWYRSKEDYDAGGSPFIKLGNSVTSGSGKTSGQFDVEQDGSLVINNVSMINHEMEYFCVFLRDTEGQTLKKGVKVEVIVPPDPLYPVVNGHMNHQYLYLDMRRQGTLNCSMEGVHPKVNLSITVIDQSQQGIYLKQVGIRYSPNEDNTYDVKVTYNYTADLSVQTSIIQCYVTGELGQQFSEVTTVEISFPPAFPIINAGHDLGHIYLEVNRTGEIECSIISSDSKTRLAWRVIDPFSEDKIVFEDCTLNALPSGDIFIVSFKCSYVVEDEDLDRLTVQCQVTDSTDEQYQNATTVELLFRKKAPTSLTPVIDGCNGRRDICALKVQSKGELTCRVEKIHQLVELRWNIFDGHQWQVSPGKMEVAGDVMSTFQYEVKKSQAILIAECFTFLDGHRISEASSKVVLVTEGDGESYNKSRHVDSLGLHLLTIFFIIVFGLIDVIQWYFNRKMYKKSVKECLCNTPPRSRPHSAFFSKEGAKQDKPQDSPDSGNSGSTSKMRRGSNASEKVHLVKDIPVSNGCSNQTEVDMTEENFEDPTDMQLNT